MPSVRACHSRFFSDFDFFLRMGTRGSIELFDRHFVFSSFVLLTSTRPKSEEPPQPRNPRFLKDTVKCREPSYKLSVRAFGIFL